MVVVEREDAALPRLPAAWIGETVAFMSDLQVGLWLSNESIVREMVDTLVGDPPAVVLLGGDLLYGSSGVDDQIDLIVDVSALLVEGDIPTFAVLGSHDFESGGADRLTEAFEAIGIEVLENEAVSARGPGDGFQLVGIAPDFGGRDAPLRGICQVPEGAARIVFMHNPRSFRQLPAGSAPLAVAGHTHRAQVRIPFTPAGLYQPLTGDVPVAGWSGTYGEPGNRLYVSRGVGTSIIPIRVTSPPELTLVMLAAAPD